MKSIDIWSMPLEEQDALGEKLRRKYRDFNVKVEELTCNEVTWRYSQPFEEICLFIYVSGTEDVPSDIAKKLADLAVEFAVERYKNTEPSSRPGKVRVLGPGDDARYAADINYA